jgi:hypothetical protein
MRKEDYVYKPLLAKTADNTDEEPGTLRGGKQPLWTRKRVLIACCSSLVLIGALITIYMALAGHIGAGNNNDIKDGTNSTIVTDSILAPLPTPSSSSSSSSSYETQKPPVSTRITTTMAVTPTSNAMSDVGGVLEKIYGYWGGTNGPNSAIKVVATKNISGFNMQDLKETFEPLESQMTGEILESWQKFKNTPKNTLENAKKLYSFMDCLKQNSTSFPVLYKALWDTLTSNGRVKKSKEITLLCWVWGSMWGAMEPRYVTYYVIMVGSWYYVDSVYPKDVMGVEADHPEEEIQMTNSEFEVTYKDLP